jgi:hypothetical protein
MIIGRGSYGAKGESSRTATSSVLGLGPPVPTTSSESLGTVVHKTSVAMGRKYDAENQQIPPPTIHLERCLGLVTAVTVKSYCFGRCNIVTLKVDAVSSPKV